MYQATPAIVVCLCLVGTLTFHFLKSTWLSTSLPPGPKGYPIIGNALDIPANAPWRTFQKWAKQYGDVMRVKIPMHNLIVLDSAEAAFDLLDKRSEIYSDRPTFIMHKLLCMDKIFAMMGNTPEWRYQRRQFHSYFQHKEIAKYQPVQLYQCRAFLKRVMDNPSDLGGHVRFLHTAIILKIVHDMDIQSLGDEYVQLAATAVSSGTLSSLPGKFWIEYLPFLRYLPSWFPGAYFKRFAEDNRPVTLRVLNRPFDTIKEQRANGYTGTSLTANLLDQLDKIEDEAEKRDREYLMRNIAATAYIGAADTPTDATHNFFIAMSLYPEVQRKAQAELDRVIGTDRLPDFSDYDDLVYIQATILETMRWIPVTPIIFPHRVTVDDHYKGFHIPKGTMVLANAWSILHDPNDYPDPERFNPDRFIKDGRLNPDVRDPLTIAFGFGRRICPGRWFANSSLFLTIASTLHIFNIEPILTPDGSTLDPFGEGSDSGVKLHHEGIPCTVTPRSTAAKRLVSEWFAEHE